MKFFKSLAVVLALAAGAPAMAACSNTFNLGVIATPALQGFGNSFGSVQHFNDCYNFTLNAPANTFGLVFGLDASLRRDIDLSSVSLSGGSLSSTIFGAAPGDFSFSNLLAGSYQFVVSGDVTGRNGGLFGGGEVGYGGIFAAAGSSAVPPVPEPATYAQLALGLLAVGWVMSRRNRV